MSTYGTLALNGGGVGARSLGKPAAVYPGAIADDSRLKIAVDRFQVKLAASLNDVALSMTVDNAAGLVANMLLSIDDEIVSVTGAPAGNVVPISRAFDGTAAAIHLSGSTVSGFIDAWHHNALVSEVEAIENALGANLSKIPSSAFISSSAYVFTPQSPGGSLTVGANPIVLSPVPQGVNGTDNGHFLYISGGTGTPEPVPIIGGTAVAGAASGTVIVTCANAHSGAWTIQSATAGIQEALQKAGTFNGVVITAGLNKIYAPIIFPYSYQTLSGIGWYTSIIESQVSTGVVITVPSGIAANTADVIIVPAGIVAPTLMDFGTSRFNGYSVLPTNGKTVRILNATTYSIVTMRSLWLRHNFDAIDMVPSPGVCGEVFMQNVTVEAVANTAIIGMLGMSSQFQYLLCASGMSYGGPAYSVTYTPVDIIRIVFADGCLFTDTWIGGPISNSVVNFDCPSTGSARVGRVMFLHTMCDAWTGGPAVKFEGTVGASAIRFNDCDWATATTNLNPVFRFNSPVSDLSIRNCLFALIGGPIFDGTTDSVPTALRGLEFTNNMLETVSNGIPCIALGQWPDVSILGNKWFVGGGGAPNYIITGSFPLSNLRIVGNGLDVYSTLPLNITGALTNPVIRNNGLVEAINTTVASAATINLAAGYTTFIITGTTGISTITGLYEGRQVVLITNSGSVTFTASATIAVTTTSVLNVPLTGFVIAGKLYLK